MYHVSIEPMVYNTFNSARQVNLSPYELILGKPGLLLNMQTGPNVKLSGAFKDYYELLKKDSSIYMNYYKNTK